MGTAAPASSSSSLSVSDTQGVVQQFVNLVLDPSVPCSSHPEPMDQEDIQVYSGNPTCLGPVIWLPGTASSNRP